MVRSDLKIPQLQVVVETKCTREKMQLKKLTEEIEADIVHYSEKNIIFFVYDKYKIIKERQSYEKYFNRTFDGKNVKSEKVNTAFLGCKMKAGEHDIVITYHAPGMAAGKVMSFVGMMGFLILSVLEHVDTKK